MEKPLNKVQTGLFVDKNKVNALLDIIREVMKNKHNVRAVSSQRQEGGMCEVVLYSLRTGANFAAAKVMLEHYLKVIKETRPNFKFEHKPEVIDLEDEDSEVSMVYLEETEESKGTESEVIDLDCTENKTTEEISEECTKTGETKGAKGRKNEVVDLDCTENETTENISEVCTKTDKKLISEEAVETDENESDSDEEIICLDKTEMSEKTLSPSTNVHKADKSPDNTSNELNATSTEKTEEIMKPSTSLSCKSDGKSEENADENITIIDLESSTIAQCQSPPLASSPNTECRSVLKESNGQQRKRQLETVEDDVQIIEEEVVIVDLSCSVESPKKKRKLDESGDKNDNAVSNDDSLNLLKTVEDFSKKCENYIEAISTVVKSQPAKKSPSSPQKTTWTENVTPINLLDVPKQTTSSDRKCSKLSYKKPAHMVQPLVEKKLKVSRWSDHPPSTSTSISVTPQYNIYNPNAGKEKKRSGLRPIVIDGNNVGVGHGKGVFSLRGLQICINYFERKGHRQIKAFLPQYRKNRDTHDLIKKMEQQGTLVTTPSRRVDGKVISSYDDRYIVQYADECGGVIVSTDNFRDLMAEEPSWRDTIKNRLLMFTWVDDMIMFPKDPLGKDGPTLETFLKFPD